VWPADSSALQAKHGHGGRTAAAIAVAAIHVSVSSRHRLAFAAVLAAVLGLWAVVPLPSSATSEQQLRSRIAGAQSRERGLAGDVAALSGLIAQLDGDIAVLSRRQGEVEAQLAAKQAEVAATAQQLRDERVRIHTLRARLARSRVALSRRLVETYEVGRPDVVTVILSSHGFADLLERMDFVRRIERQDAEVTDAVRRARDAARRAADRLVTLGRLRRAQAAANAAQRSALASMRAALDAKRAGAARARAARVAALRATRGDRARAEHELAALQAQQRAAATQRFGPSGGWAIPWAIVQCESGGQNLPPNSAGASGYYQILPSTWKGFGGSTPQAYQAPKSEQDRVAARIWRGGAGASDWVCAALVHAG
jgi:peptidoglycan hydrolase CwlO-like protein